MNDLYWKNFYSVRHGSIEEPSSFAKYIQRKLGKGEGKKFIELGCGNERDLRFFTRSFPEMNVLGIDKATGIDVAEYIKERKPCEFDYVYTRFFWHSIPHQLQKSILNWTKDYLFIEARTTQDEYRPKAFPVHSRRYVKVKELIEELKHYGFDIIEMKEGTGFSPIEGEDPHLVRIIAKKIK